MQRAFAALLTLTLPIIALPIATGHAASRRPVAQHHLLEGANRITADRSLRADVLIPVDLSMSARAKHARPGDSTITFTGGGRISGVVLVPDPVVAYEPQFAILRVHECATSCGGRQARPMTVSFPFLERIRVEAGSYSLHVIADGPVTMTWSIPQLTGSTTVPASAAAELDLATPRSAVTTSKDVTAYEASHSYRFTSEYGMAFSTTWVRGRSYKGSRMSYCFSDEDVEHPGPTRTVGSCEMLGTGFVGVHGDEISLVDARAGRFALATFLFMRAYDAPVLPANGSRWTYGFTALSPGPVDSVGSHAMVLSY